MKTPTVKITENVMSEVVIVVQSFGVPSHVLGYEYIKTAVSHLLEHPEYLSQITGKLYRAIAIEHGSTPSRVERAIRHAIEIAFNRTDPDYLERLYGGFVPAEKGRIINSEFLALLAERVRMKIGAYNAPMA